MKYFNYNGARKNQRMIWIAIMLFAMLSLNLSYGYDASGGNITIRGGLGAISFDGNSSHILGGIVPASKYTYATIEGYFGIKRFQNNTALNNNLTPPSIELLSPSNYALITYSNISFLFNVSDESGLRNCTLYIDSIIKEIINYPTNGLNTINASILPGNHTWKLNCYDLNNNYEWSQNRTITIVLASNFDNDTTDLSSVNISAVSNLTFAKSGKGKINFFTDTNLEEVYDLDSYITIGDLSISVNSTMLPMLNKSATLTMFNVSYQNIVILRDGIVCNDCAINSQALGVVIFTVPGFSTYTLSSTARLEIFDDTDTVQKQLFENVGFYANYSNASSGAPISSTCQISFDLNGWTTPEVMIYNSSSALHEYYRSFNLSDTYNFNVSCEASVLGFDNLSTIDDFIISNIRTGSLANINITNISSSRFNDARPAGTINASAGNVTEINTYTTLTSGAWQGYYGDITGEIMLADVSGNKFYNWNKTSVSGEIMATRNNNIVWTSISCIDQNSVDDEDAYIGRISTDGDSLNNTFNMSNHPVFMISNNTLSGCRSTRTFREISQIGLWSIALSDSAGSIIYAGILSDNAPNFRNSTSDFELLVPVEYGIIETYYFYLELN